ncbi:MAG: methyltransferase domain-containing protein [Acidobacteria bacterium]|nr:methyltransferase domain-containing protein [Acidobacteriota bacterium]
MSKTDRATQRTPQRTERATPSRRDQDDDEHLERLWKQAYGARTRDDLRELYAAWARTYDADHERVGFFGHRLAAEVLARNLTRHDVARVLDAGAGTGAAGEALTELGFRDLTAVDLSPDMLRVAEAKGLYRETRVADLSLPVDAYPESSFDAAILVGVFSYGQAPPETLDEVLRLVRPGGVVALTARTDFLAKDAMGVASKLRDLERAGDPVSEPTQVLGVQAPGSRASIAVLPFLDLSREGDQDYLCRGLAEELIHRFSGVPGLRVASRTSSFQFQGQTEDAREIGRRLNVESILEGSVRKDGDRLRVTVQLVQSADGYQLWSERYDHEMRDVFAVQDEIARRVVEAVQGAWLETAEHVRDPSRQPSLDAYDLYLKARVEWDRRTEESLRRSIELCEGALELQPGFARAHAALADAYLLLGVYGAAAPDDVLPIARTAAEKALELEPNLAQCHATLGCLEALYEWDQAASARRFQRALELDPQCAPAHQWYAMNHLVPTGKFSAAGRHLRIALELDPINPAINVSLGLGFFYARRFAEAETELRRAVDVDEAFSPAYFFLGRTLDQLGRGGEAVAALEHAIELSGGSAEMRMALGCALAGVGDLRRARQMLHELREESVHRYVSPALRAQLQLRLGDREAALDALDQAVGVRASDLIWAGVSPAYDELREEERFAAMLERIGLAAADEDAAG